MSLSMEYIRFFSVKFEFPPFWHTYEAKSEVMQIDTTGVRHCRTLITLEWG